MPAQRLRRTPRSRVTCATGRPLSITEVLHQPGDDRGRELPHRDGARRPPSGYRAYRRSVHETVPFEANSDDFVFDQEFIMPARHFGFGIGELPVPVTYSDDASTIDLRRSIVYGCGALRCMLSAHRVGLRG